MRATTRTAAFLVLYTGLVAGCAGPSTGDVSGTAVYDGTPVEKGAIEFRPVDGKGQTAGGTIEGGKYTVKAGGKVVESGTQMIGKDNLAGALHSWPQSSHRNVSTSGLCGMTRRPRGDGTWA